MGDKVRLNHELLIWRGFTLSNGVWSDPDGVTVSEVPYFPESLDAIFRWLVDDAIKLLYPGYKWGDGWRELFNRWINNMEAGREPALALCLAIQKLIRSK